MKSKYITEKLLNRVFNNELCTDGRDIISLFKEKKIFLNNKLEIKNIKEINKGKKFILEQFGTVPSHYSHYLGIYYHAILQCINTRSAMDFYTQHRWLFTPANSLTRTFNILYKEALK